MITFWISLLMLYIPEQESVQTYTSICRTVCSPTMFRTSTEVLTETTSSIFIRTKAPLRFYFDMTRGTRAMLMQ